MTANRLLQLYPRAWRERYGDEFLALVGDRPLGVTQIIDIVSAAIDAHLSSDVRAMTSRRQVTQLQAEVAGPGREPDPASIAELICRVSSFLAARDSRGSGDKN